MLKNREFRENTDQCTGVVHQQKIHKRVTSNEREANSEIIVQTNEERKQIHTTYRVDRTIAHKKNICNYGSHELRKDNF